MILNLIEIPYPFAPWLNLDLSEIVVLVAISTLGFVPALFVCICNFFITARPFYFCLCMIHFQLFALRHVQHNTFFIELWFRCRLYSTSLYSGKYKNCYHCNRQKVFSYTSPYFFIHTLSFPVISNLKNTFYKTFASGNNVRSITSTLAKYLRFLSYLSPPFP